MILLLPMNKNLFIILLSWEYNYLLCITTFNHLSQYFIISLQAFSYCFICCSVSFTNFVTNDLTVFIVSVLLIFFWLFCNDWNEISWGNNLILFFCYNLVINIVTIWLFFCNNNVINFVVIIWLLFCNNWVDINFVAFIWLLFHVESVQYYVRA